MDVGRLAARRSHLGSWWLLRHEFKEYAIGRFRRNPHQLPMGEGRNWHWHRLTKRLHPLLLHVIIDRIDVGYVKDNFKYTLATIVQKFADDLRDILIFVNRRDEFEDSALVANFE
jgi:hypothetical protein